MSKVLIFSGTSEGRKLAEWMQKYGRPFHVSVATEYGAGMMEGEARECVTVGRRNREEMEELMEQEAVTEVVDATHPYAVEVSRNIREACRNRDLPYLRLLRQSEEEDIRSRKDVLCVRSAEEAAQVLRDHPGKALLTIGSKELRPFTEIEDYAQRFAVRVLPTAESLDSCRSLGFEESKIIAMQGPFTEEMNTALLRQTGSVYLVTKESGRAGGVPEKISAAQKAGAKVILILRPTEEAGYSMEEIVRRVCPEALSEVKDLDLIPLDPRRITLLGIGMGAENQLTREGEEACGKADVLIGAGRILQTLSGFGKPVFETYKTEEILLYIHEHPEYHRVVVAFSGDVGFYSGAKKLLEGLEEDRVDLICGISSVEYFCSRLRIPWEDVTLVSNHGRKSNLPAAVRENTRVFTLTGSAAGMNAVCQELAEWGLKDVKLWVGENLSYPDEKIREGSPEELMNEKFSSLCVALIVNPRAAGSVVTPGLPDDSFLRGNVPMTKEEVRSICLSKLRLTRRSVLWDVGAGTGSVSVEAARIAAEGRVCAIEKNEQALELIRQNAHRFGVSNLTVAEGTAPEVLETLPKPTHVFVGGSGGRLTEILDAARMTNPDVRIVVTAVTLETAAALTTYLREHRALHQELVQVSVARAREAGDSHLLHGSNPVTIAAFDDRGEEP